MKTTSYFRLNKKALIMVLVSAAYPSIGFSAAAAKVEFSVGNVLATGLDGRERSLGKGGEINAGDTVQTQEGRAQLRFSDGGYISLQPNTQFRVDEYAYDGKTDGHEKGFFSLLKGGLRAITGAVGHVNKATYRINTPVATIGIRGTEFLAQYNGTLLVKVGNGAVYMTNSGGDLTLFKGQVGEVKDQGSKPKYSNEEPSVTAAGPKGGTPAVVQQQSQQEQQQSETFTVAEQYNADGTSCVVTGTCPVVTSASPTAFKTLTSQGVSMVHYQDPPGGLSAKFETTLTGTIELDSAGNIIKVSGDDYSATNFTGTWKESMNDRDLSWGRLTGGTALVTDLGGTKTFNVSNVHLIYGNPTSAADIASAFSGFGSASYTLAGATHPTDAVGNVGTLDSGNLTVYFGGSPTVSTNLQITMASGAASGSYYFFGSGAIVGGTFTINGSVSGCASSCTGTANGFFAGPNAAQAGLSYFVDSGSTTAGHITGTAAFSKSPPPL